MLKITQKRKEKIKNDIRKRFERRLKRSMDFLRGEIVSITWDTRYLKLPGQKSRAEIELEKAIYLFGSYMDGVITESELISELAKLPQDITDLLPDEFESSHRYKSLKTKINKLREAIKRGDTITIAS